MATVNPRIGEIVADLPGVVEATRTQRDRVAGIAEGLFASHDEPGGHEILIRDDASGIFIDFVGPAPLAVEYGHWTPDHDEFVEGLHVLGRSVAAAAL